MARVSRRGVRAETRTNPQGATLMPHPSPHELPVAVIGAGPVGLAAAAHLVERGIEPLIVLEAGGASAPACASGATSASSRRGSTTSTRSPRRCWPPPAGPPPTPTATRPASDLVERYLEPLAALPEIAPRAAPRRRA